MRHYDLLDIENNQWYNCARKNWRRNMNIPVYREDKMELAPKEEEEKRMKKEDKEALMEIYS